MPTQEDLDAVATLQRKERDSDRQARHAFWLLVRFLDGPADLEKAREFAKGLVLKLKNGESVSLN